MKSIISLIIIVFIFNVTLSCTTTPFDYKISNVHCYQNSLKNGNVGIKMKQDDYSYTLSPDSKIILIDSNNVVYYNINGSVEYTLTWTHNSDSSCSGSEIIKQESAVFEYSQPKCRYSAGSISYSGPAASHIVDGRPITLPYVNSIENSHEIVTTFDSDPSESCIMTFHFYELSDKGYPDLSITDDECNSKSGSIHVNNYEKFTSVSLYDKANDEVYQPSTGLFKNLESGQYFLQLESKECDQQRIPITISTSFPQFNIVQGSIGACPTNSSFKIQYDTDKYNFNIKIDDVVLSDSTFYLNGSRSFLLDLINPQCSFSSLMNVPDPILDVQYSINHPKDCISGDPTVSLIYDETVITDLEIKDEFGNNQVLLSNSKSFSAKYNQAYSIYSPCHSFTYIWIKPTPVHSSLVYKLSQQPTICGDTFNMFIYNYLDYDKVSIKGTNLIMDTNGWISNLTTSTYTFLIEYSSCKGPITEQVLDFTVEPDLSDLQETWSILENPICNLSKGKIQYKFNSPSLNLQGSVVTLFLPNSNIELTASASKPGCSISKKSNWYSPSIYNNDNINRFKVEIIKETSCLYSSDASVMIINSLKSFTPIFFWVENDVQVTPSFANSTHYKLDGFSFGRQTLQIKYIGCDTNEYQLSFDIKSNSTFKLDYSIQSINQCDKNDASITINNDLSIFSNYGLIDEPISSTGIFSQLSSRMYQLEFNLLDGTCKGIENIYIPTDGMNLTPDIRNIKLPTCENSDDGIVQLEYMIDQSNNRLIVDSIYDIKTNKTYTSGIIGENNLKSGTYNLIATSGHCSWRVDHILPLQETPSFSYEIVSHSETGLCNINSFIQFKSNSQVEIDRVEAPLATNIDGSVVYGNFAGSTFDAYIHYGGKSKCMSSIQVKDPFKRIEKQGPLITLEKTDCTSNILGGKVVIDNSIGYKIDWLSLSPNENSQLNLPLLPSNLMYMDLSTGCKRSIPLISVNDGFDIKITNETCYGGNDGIVDVSSDNGVYKMISNLSFSTFYKQPSIVNNQFGYLSTGETILYKQMKSNPFCLMSEKISIVGKEPVLELISSQLCDDTYNGGQIINNINVNVENVSYNISGGDTNIISNNKTVNVVNGNYYTVATIQDSKCKRILTSDIVSVQFDKCESSTKNNNNRKLILGLAIGLPLGIAFIAAIVVTIIVLKKKKTANSPNVKLGKMK